MSYKFTSNVVFPTLIIASTFTIPVDAEESAICAKPGLVLEPIMKTHTFFEYPREALRLHQQGIGIFLVTIGTDGLPTDVEVSKSSAADRLNDRAIEHIRKNWRWKPPLRDCQSSTAQQFVNFVWNQMAWGPDPHPAFHIKMPLSALPPTALEKPEGGRSTVVIVDVDDQGAVTGGRVIESSGFPDLDEQALPVLRNSPALMKGQKPGKYVIATDWEIPAGTFPKDSETVLMTGAAMPPYP